MAETIASLGGVPLGKAGTGTAVILGEKDYSYLKPKEVKEKKYTPLIGDDEIGRLIKEAGTVWKPDQAAGAEKVNNIIDKTKQMELLNKSGEKEAARKMYYDIQQDVLKFGNFIKNSKVNETNGLQFENDREKYALLFDDEDDQVYKQWLAKPVEEREMNPPIKRADDVNYVSYAIGNMDKMMKPDTDTKVRDVGGFRNSQKNTYYTEDEVRNAATKAAYNMSGKYMNFWKQKMLSKAVEDDPDTPENEKEIALEIVSKLGPEGTSKEFFDFVANQNYLLFADRMERVDKRSAPKPPVKAAGGGGGGKEPFSISTGQSQYGLGPQGTVYTDIYSSKVSGKMPEKEWKIPLPMLIEANKKYGLGLDADLEEAIRTNAPFVTISGTFVKASRNQGTGEATVTITPMRYEDNMLTKWTAKGGITLPLGPENVADVKAVLNNQDPYVLFEQEEKKKMTKGAKARKEPSPPGQPAVGQPKPGTAQPKPATAAPDFSKMTPEQIKAWYIQNRKLNTKK